PAAFLWGASFPLAIAAVVAPGQDAGRLVGRVYAANTVGAIIGSLVFSVVLIPQVGTQNAERTLVVVAIAAAVVVFLSLVGSKPAVMPAKRETRNPVTARGGELLGALVAAIVAIVLTTKVPKVPDGLIAYGRFCRPTPRSPSICTWVRG